MNAWMQYTLIRLALFAGVLAALLLLGIEPILAALIAAVVGMAVSYIFFRGQRGAVAEALAARVGKRPVNADAAEDDTLDRRDQA